MNRRKQFLGASVALATVALALVVLGGGATGSSGSGKGLHGQVWVTNKSLNTVAVFDASSGQVLANIPVGSTPIGVAIPKGTHKAYVSNEGSNTVSVIDTDSFAIIKTIAMGAGPHHMMASPDGKRIYVGEYNANTVGVIDTNTDEEIARYVTSPNPVAKTHAVYVTDDGATLYATDFATNELVALGAATGAVEWRLHLTGSPSEALVTSDRKTAYVSIRSRNSVAVIDLGSHALVAEKWVGTMPDTLQLMPDGKHLVVTLRGTPAQISILDTGSLETNLIALTGTTTGHHWLSASGRYSFVAIEGPGGLALVDNATGRTVTTFAYPGGGKPHGVFFWPQGGDDSGSD